MTSFRKIQIASKINKPKIAIIARCGTVSNTMSPGNQRNNPQSGMLTEPVWRAAGHGPHFRVNFQGGRSSLTFSSGCTSLPCLLLCLEELGACKLASRESGRPRVTFRLKMKQVSLWNAGAKDKHSQPSQETQVSKYKLFLSSHHPFLPPATSVPIKDARRRLPSGPRA